MFYIFSFWRQEKEEKAVKLRQRLEIFRSIFL